MKIKCPFWNDCFVEVEPAELFTHFKSEHHSGEITHAYWELIVKIHKKREEVRESVSDLYHDYDVEEILESLLEDFKQPKEPADKLFKMWTEEDDKPHQTGCDCPAHTGGGYLG